ncbi:MAG: hypothetical protein CMO81_02270 [Waddliaceae bacterium]|nr:hypothetical protein [Waddliaceae bacterium]
MISNSNLNDFNIDYYSRGKSSSIYPAIGFGEAIADDQYGISKPLTIAITALKDISVKASLSTPKRFYEEKAKVTMFHNRSWESIKAKPYEGENPIYLENDAVCEKVLRAGERWFITLYNETPHGRYKSSKNIAPFTLDIRTDNDYYRYLQLKLKPECHTFSNRKPVANPSSKTPYAECYKKKYTATPISNSTNKNDFNGVSSYNSNTPYTDWLLGYQEEPRFSQTLYPNINEDNYYNSDPYNSMDGLQSTTIGSKFHSEFYSYPPSNYSESCGLTPLSSDEPSQNISMNFTPFSATYPTRYIPPSNVSQKAKDIINRLQNQYPNQYPNQ